MNFSMMMAHRYQELLRELLALLERSRRLRVQGERIDAEIFCLQQLSAKLQEATKNPSAANVRGIAKPR